MKRWQIIDNSLHVNVDTLYVQHDNLYTVSAHACTHKICRVCMYYVEHFKIVHMYNITKIRHTYVGTIHDI